MLFHTTEDKRPAEGAIKAVIDSFHEALNAMLAGDAAPMEAVWAHTSDVIYIGPGGEYRIGWPQVRAEWARQAALKIGGSVKMMEIQVTADEKLAVVGNYVKGENFDMEEDAMPVSLRASSLFSNEDGQWKMIGLRTRPLPFSL